MTMPGSELAVNVLRSMIVASGDGRRHFMHHLIQRVIERRDGDYERHGLAERENFASFALW